MLLLQSKGWFPMLSSFSSFVTDTNCSGCNPKCLPQKTKHNYVLPMAISQTRGHFKMSSGKPGAEFPSLVAPNLAQCSH